MPTKKTTRPICYVPDTIIAELNHPESGDDRTRQKRYDLALDTRLKKSPYLVQTILSKYLFLGVAFSATKENGRSATKVRAWLPLQRIAVNILI